MERQGENWMQLEQGEGKGEGEVWMLLRLIEDESLTLLALRGNESLTQSKLHESEG